MQVINCIGVSEMLLNNISINQYVLDVSRSGESSGEVNFGSALGELQLRRMKLKQISQIMERIILDQILDRIITDQRLRMLRKVEQQIIILVLKV